MIKKKRASKKIQLDVSGYDRSTVIWEVRSSYTLGYDEIHVHFKNMETAHLRKSDRVFVRDLLNYTASRLIGVKMEPVNANLCILKVPAQATKDNISDLSKRVTKMIIEMHAELLLLMKGHLYVAPLIDEKHDSITKLISYAKRTIIISPTAPDTLIEYHILSQIDKIADIIKYIGRDYVKAQRQVSKTTATIFEHMHQILLFYENTHTRFTTKDVASFSLKRDDVKRYMRDSISSSNPQEVFLLGQATAVIEILIDMVESCMMLDKTRSLQKHAR